MGFLGCIVKIAPKFCLYFRVHGTLVLVTNETLLSLCLLEVLEQAYSGYLDCNISSSADSLPQ